MPSFREVGLKLKDKFDGAIKVIGTNDGKGVQPAEETLKPPGRLDLVYTENSPNFCRRNKKYGSIGTRGRQCNPDDMGVGGCDLLCCNRGYRKETVLMRENCKCRFIWCCDVICETCEYKKDVHMCL